MAYAKGTQVAQSRSRAELERILQKAGATKVAYMYEDGAATVAFELTGKTVKLVIKVPTVDDILLKAETDQKKPYGWVGASTARRREWAVQTQDAEHRRKWRVLILLLKAKLEAIEEGESTVEREFLYDLVIKGGRTVGEMIQPNIDNVLAGSSRPHLMLGMGDK